MKEDLKLMTCVLCGESYFGSETLEDNQKCCPECLAAKELPVLGENEPLPESVEAEFDGGEDVE